MPHVLARALAIGSLLFACSSPIEEEGRRSASGLTESVRHVCAGNPATPIFPPGVGQIGNPGYCPEVSDPAFAFGKGPRVVFDEGHHNYGTINPSADSPAAGRAYALAELLRADGFVVDASRGPLTSAGLAGARVLVLSHALPAPYSIFDSSQGRWVHNPAAFAPASAYSPQEIDVVVAWVRGGGAVLINSEHVPFTGAMAPLTRAFGIALDPNMLGVTAPAFTKSTPNHPIFRGRQASEVALVVPFVGGGGRLRLDGRNGLLPLFEAPPLSIGLNITPKGFEASLQAIECRQAPGDRDCAFYSRLQARETSAYPAGGAVVAATEVVGAGRLAAFTEFLTFTSQLIGNANESGRVESVYRGLKDNRSVPLYGVPQNDADDATRVVLNTFHWLAGQL